VGCRKAPAVSPADVAEVVQAPRERRSFDMHDAAVRPGIAYGPYRHGQAPWGPHPSADELREDLTLLAQHWSMVRIYSSRGPAEDMLRIIEDRQLPLRVLLGAWISADDADANAAEVAEAVRLAQAYPDIVSAVSVGNETQVYWSGHRSPAEDLIGHLRAVRGQISQPVTTADDYNFWNTPESHAVADEVDFLLLHAYAMWNKQSLEDAVPWTAGVVQAIAREHPHLPLVLGETGWATEKNPDATGDQATQITAEAGEAAQRAFYEHFTAWASSAGIPYFYFEAFDEPWKGGDDPREVEKHWGLYRVDRTPKPALSEASR
jgi:exo-beta-1,3-glucanase (GH17 family)